MKSCILCESRKLSRIYILGDFDIYKCSQCGLISTRGGERTSYKQSLQDQRSYKQSLWLRLKQSLLFFNNHSKQSLQDQRSYKQSLQDQRSYKQSLQDQRSYKDYFRDQDYSKFESYFKNIFQKRFNIIKKYKNSGKVLDVGASTGTLLGIFKENGWEVWGVEPSRSSEIAVRKGIKIVKSKLEDASLPRNYFDVVVFNHTLEHVEDPIAVMQIAKGILKKKGLVFIDVPNIGSFSSRLLGKRWWYLLPEEHNYHFTPATLRGLLEKTGFTVIYSRTHSGIFDYAYPVTELWDSFVGLKKRFLRNILGLPGALFSTAINKGTSLIMIGLKE